MIWQCLMCSEIPSEAQLSCIHNKLLAWKRNDLAMMLNSLWSLDISLDQVLHTLLESHKLQRGIGRRVNERVNGIRIHASKEGPQHKHLLLPHHVYAHTPFFLSVLLSFFTYFLLSCLSACLL